MYSITFCVFFFFIFYFCLEHSIKSIRDSAKQNQTKLFHTSGNKILVYSHKVRGGSRQKSAVGTALKMSLRYSVTPEYYRFQTRGSTGGSVCYF